MNRVKELREEKDWTQTDLGKKIGVQAAAVSKYETGKVPLTDDVVKKLTVIFEVNSDYILGNTDEKRPIHIIKSSFIASEGIGASVNIPSHPNNASQGRSIPILGRIKAGIPIFAEENYEGEIESDIRADFALQVRGDSMVFAGIRENDYILLLKSENAYSGQIVAAANMEDGAYDTTLKYYFIEKSNPVLRAANPVYEDIPLSKHHRIIGIYAGMIRYDEPPYNDALGLEIQSEQATSNWLDLINTAQGAGLDSNDIQGIISMIRKVKK